VLEAVVVEAEPADDDDEPGSELAASVSDVGAEPPVALFLEPFHDKSVAVHDRIVVAGQPPGDVEDQAGIRVEELSPRVLFCGTLGHLEEVLDLARERLSVFPRRVAHWLLGTRRRKDRAVPRRWPDSNQ
jgi:hypothetical protein